MGKRRSIHRAATTHRDDVKGLTGAQGAAEYAAKAEEARVVRPDHARFSMGGRLARHGGARDGKHLGRGTNIDSKKGRCA